MNEITFWQDEDGWHYSIESPGQRWSSGPYDTEQEAKEDCEQTLKEWDTV